MINAEAVETSKKELYMGKFPVYSSVSKSYKVDSSKLFTIVDSLFDFMLNQKETFRRSREFDDAYHFSSDLHGKDKTLRLITCVNDNYGHMVKMECLASLVVGSTCNDLIFNVHELHRLTEINPAGLYAIGELYQK